MVPGTDTEFTKSGTFSIPIFDISGTGSVPVFTRFYPQIPVPYRIYSIPVSTLKDFRYRYFQYRLVPSSSIVQTL
ncbi:hypothetical protein HanIR_Chr01g0007951 [Helianthus annuus]|nr:hypothetical protein HanIR_Chr01g0007951 [Helianthus annuus]